MANNYDNTTVFYIDPDGLNAQIKELTNLNHEISDSFMRIVNVMSALKLGWAGRTADEVNDFNDKWSATMASLIWIQGHQDKGVLYAILSGLDTARGNFALAENGLAQFFSEFEGDISGGGDTPTPTAPPPSMTDITQTAITETW